MGRTWRGKPKGGLKVTVSVRRGIGSDAVAVGEICYGAFKAIADEHNFPPDFPNPDSAIGFLTMLIGHEGFFDTVEALDEWPPFLVIVDVGHCIELWSDFSRQGKNYTPFPDRNRFRIFLDN